MNDQPSGRLLFERYFEYPVAAAVSPTALQIAVALNERGVVLSSLRDDRQAHILPSVSRFLNHMCFSNDGNRIAVATDRSVDVYDCETGGMVSQVQKSPKHYNSSSVPRFLSDGRLLAFADQGTVALDVGSQSSFSAAEVNALAYSTGSLSPDGWTSIDGRLRVKASPELHKAKILRVQDDQVVFDCYEPGSGTALRVMQRPGRLLIDHLPSNSSKLSQSARLLTVIDTFTGEVERQIEVAEVKQFVVDPTGRFAVVRSQRQAPLLVDLGSGVTTGIIKQVYDAHFPETYTSWLGYEFEWSPVFPYLAFCRPHPALNPYYEEAVVITFNEDSQRLWRLGVHGLHGVSFGADGGTWVNVAEARGIPNHPLVPATPSSDGCLLRVLTLPCE